MLPRSPVNGAPERAEAPRAAIDLHEPGSPGFRKGHSPALSGRAASDDNPHPSRPTDTANTTHEREPPMISPAEFQTNLTRRQFFGYGVSSAIGCAALASLNDEQANAAAPIDPTRGPVARTHHAPRARHVIYLHMVGGPP